MKASDLFVKALENEGVDRIFAVPGEENLDVVESLRTSSIELVLVRHEQSAAFMAATHGRLTGRPGVCMATLGPGALNLVTGAAYAHLGAMPMVLITGQKAIMSGAPGALPDRRHRRDDEAADQGVAPDRQRRPASRPSCATRSGSRRKSGRARCTSSCPRTSPARSSTDDVAARARCIRSRSRSRTPRALDRAAALLMQAERPLVMFGAASNRPRLAGQLTDFIRRTGIPFFNTQMGKGTVAGIGTSEGGTELWMGTAALTERDYVHEAIDRADLILAIGHDTIEKPPFIMGPKGPKVIHVGYTPANVEQVYFPHAEVVGDLGPEPGAAGRPRRGQAAERRRAGRRCARTSSSARWPAPRSRAFR